MVYLDPHLFWRIGELVETAPIDVLHSVDITRVRRSPCTPDVAVVALKTAASRGRSWWMHFIGKSLLSDLFTEWWTLKHCDVKQGENLFQMLLSDNWFNCFKVHHVSGAYGEAGYLMMGELPIDGAGYLLRWLTYYLLYPHLLVWQDSVVKTLSSKEKTFRDRLQLDINLRAKNQGVFIIDSGPGTDLPYIVDTSL